MSSLYYECGFEFRYFVTYTGLCTCFTLLGVPSITSVDLSLGTLSLIQGCVPVAHYWWRSMGMGYDERL